MEEIVIRDGEKAVTFTPGALPSRDNPYEGGHFDVTLQAPGLEASRSVFRYGFSDLGGFFKDLSSNWRGSDGVKSWESPEHDLEIVASFAAGGRVGLKFTIRDGPIYTWRVSLEVTMDAGEDMSRLAREVSEAIPRNSA